MQVVKFIVGALILTRRRVVLSSQKLSESPSGTGSARGAVVPNGSSRALLRQVTGWLRQSFQHLFIFVCWYVRINTYKIFFNLHLTIFCSLAGTSGILENTVGIIPFFAFLPAFHSVTDKTGTVGEKESAHTYSFDSHESA